MEKMILEGNVSLLVFKLKLTKHSHYILTIILLFVRLRKAIKASDDI